MPGQPPVTVTGTVYSGGAIAAQAEADLTTAYNDAAGRQTPVIVTGNIGGQTLTPGLYKSTSSLAISSGTLTLDAQGDALLLSPGIFIALRPYSEVYRVRLPLRRHYGRVDLWSHQRSG